MIVIYESIEDNNMAVLEREDGSTFSVTISTLPTAAKPGDSLMLKSDGSYEILQDDTQKRKARVQKLLDNLWEK